MDFPTATPLSSLGSESDLAGSGQLYDFLGEVLQEIRGVSSKGHMDSYATLLGSLSENFLMKLPEPSKVTWASQTEAIRLTDRSIDILEQVILKVEGFIESNSHLLQVVLSGLVHLSCTLNVWILEDQQALPSSNQVTNPITLRRKATLCAVTIISFISNPVKTALASRSRPELHPRHILGTLLSANNGQLKSSVKQCAYD
jgi:hypothetical protein